jgi:hypothetical protein
MAALFLEDCGMVMSLSNSKPQSISLNIKKVLTRVCQRHGWELRVFAIGQTSTAFIITQDQLCN